MFWWNRSPRTKSRRGRAAARPRVEGLERRVALAAFAGIFNGQLRITDDNAADVITLDHSGSSTLVGGLTFPDAQITNGILIQVGSGGPGTGLDTVNILATVKPVTVDGQFDTKAVNLGKAGSVQGIQAPVTIFDLAEGNFDSLTVDDSADAIGRNVTLNASGSVGTLFNLARGRSRSPRHRMAR
jgi:hypothetical protein